MRPFDILTTWTCEELLVAYGVYANAKSKEGYDILSKGERRKRNLNWFDRWAMPFFDQSSLEELAKMGEARQSESQEALEMANIADALFS